MCRHPPGSHTCHESRSRSWPCFDPRLPCSGEATRKPPSRALAGVHRRAGNSARWTELLRQGIGVGFPGYDYKAERDSASCEFAGQHVGVVAGFSPEASRACLRWLHSGAALQGADQVFTTGLVLQE